MYLILFLKGMIFGVANIIPGVSGGTMAVTLNVFDKLIDSINNIFTNTKESLKFLIPFVAGAGVGILVFSSVISYGLINYPVETTMLFLGLLLGSYPLIMNKAKSSDFKPIYLLGTLAGFSLLVFMTMINPEKSTDITGVVFNWQLYLKLFFAGIISSVAMITPGISGSLIMVIMGLYPILIYGISLLKDFLLDISNVSILFSSMQILVPIGLGILVGVGVASKIIGYLLEKYYSLTYLVILGLMAGSCFSMLYEVFANGQGHSMQISTMLMSAGCVVIGAAIAVVLGKE